MLSLLFIRRPKTAAVISIALFLAGANSRHAVGVATFWGMLTATLVGMLFVPPLYVFFRRLAGVKG